MRESRNSRKFSKWALKMFKDEIYKIVIIIIGGTSNTTGREKKREDIFSQVFTMLHNRSFVQNVHTKTGMEPHDQFWPSSCDTLILLDQFLLSWHSFLSCTISYFRSLEGKCHLQLKFFNYFWKKQEKEFNLWVIVRLRAHKVRQTDKRGEAQKTQLYCFM